MGDQKSVGEQFSNTLSEIPLEILISEPLDLINKANFNVPIKWLEQCYESNMLKKMTDSDGKEYITSPSIKLSLFTGTDPETQKDQYINLEYPFLLFGISSSLVEYKTLNTTLNIEVTRSITNTNSTSNNKNTEQEFETGAKLSGGYPPFFEVEASAQYRNSLRGGYMSDRNITNKNLNKAKLTLELEAEKVGVPRGVEVLGKYLEEALISKTNKNAILTLTQKTDFMNTTLQSGQTVGYKIIDYFIITEDFEIDIIYTTSKDGMDDVTGSYDTNSPTYIEINTQDNTITFSYTEEIDSIKCQIQITTTSGSLKSKEFTITMS